MSLPTVERLREVLNYDPETGIFTWRQHRKSPMIGQLAGGYRKPGYLFISVDERKVGGHRIAWAMVHGEWADKLIDHKNCNPSDNRIENLRLADKSLNGHNSGPQINNTSGYKCVYWSKQRHKWKAQTVINGAEHYIGLYETKEAAHEAYVAYAKEKLGEFARSKK